MVKRAGRESNLSPAVTNPLRPIRFEAMDEPIQLPIDGVLDLHTFQPREIKDLVPDYLAACQDKGILRVRIIHGKGIGNLRRTVHSILAKHPAVVSFTLDHPQYGGWGATIVQLRRPQPPPEVS
jgi:DNA-nicking Smr family endonuclease